MERKSLTPREIIDYLKIIEQRTGHKVFRLYVPKILVNDGIITQEELTQEALSMFHFVGLSTYIPVVKFAKTDKDAGGFITGQSCDARSGLADITVSEVHKSDKEATLAILAHEICHKLLSSIGLKYDDEILTDLTTIYVGFGELIIKGYVRANYTLGYLDFENYKLAHKIMCIISGRIQNENLGLRETDILAENALRIWNGTEDKNKLLNEYFSKREQLLSLLHRNINLLFQVLAEIKLKVQDEFELGDRLFYKDTNRKGNEYNNIITAFSTVYELLCQSDTITDNNGNIIDSIYKGKSNIIKIYQVIEQSLMDIYITINEISTIDFNYDTTTCPVCNHKMNTEKIGSRVVIISCPSCHSHFLYNGERWIPTRAKREIEIQIKKEIEDRYISRTESLEKEYLRKTESLEKEYLRKTESLEKDYRCWTDNLQRQTKLQRERVNAILSSIPRWKRFLVKKYFQKID